jgi:hypothetical protein
MTPAQTILTCLVILVVIGMCIIVIKFGGKK